MGNYREWEAGLQFGNAYLELFKFVVHEVSKDAYLFLLPDLGFKLSIHQPKPPDFPTIHAHWKNTKLNFHEDIDGDIFSKKNLEETAMLFAESFRPCQLSGDEDVMVIHNFLADAMQNEIRGKKEKTRLDIGKVMQTMCKCTFYQTKARKLPLLIRHLKRQNLYLGFNNDLNVCALAENRMIMPLSSKTMIEFDQQPFMENLGKTGLSSLFSPMQRAIDAISRTNPDVFQRRFPISGMEDFMKQQATTLSQSKPTIVNF